MFAGLVVKVPVVWPVISRSLFAYQVSLRPSCSVLTGTRFINGETSTSITQVSADG